MCCGRGAGLSPAIAVNDIVVVIVDIDVLEKEINFLLFCGGVLVASNSWKTQKNVTVSTLELNLGLTVQPAELESILFLCYVCIVGQK